VPISRSRSERFDDLVLDAVERLEQRWEAQLRDLEVAVEDVPPGDPPPDAVEPVLLGRAFPATRAHPPRIVVYRRPVELRADDDRELAELVHDVVVEQVAELLGLDPAAVDPRYRGGADDEED
jgi:predicted Zn-dependent protease with MMP-like domain